MGVFQTCQVFLSVSVAAALFGEKIEKFTLEEAKLFASLAQLSYCDDHSDVRDWSCVACQNSGTPVVPGTVRTIDGGEQNATHVLMARLAAQKGCFVAFRGSSNAFNWVRNLQTEQVEAVDYRHCDGCKVHHGFYQIWQNVKPKVLAGLDDIGCNIAENNLLYITGHSLGGALAHLAMFTLSTDGFEIAKTYTFEAPRVGNNKFADAFHAEFGREIPVYRITHKWDPAVHVPGLLDGYEHVDTEVFFDDDEKFTVCPKREDNACSNQHHNLITDLMHYKDHCAAPALLQNAMFCAGGTEVCVAPKIELQV